MNTNFRLRRKPRQGIAAQLLTLVGTALALAVALTFSLVVVAVVAVAGVLIWGYVWWKTRELRRQMRDAMAAQAAGAQGARPTAGADESTAASGAIIEGEAVRVVDEDKRIAG